MALPRLKRQDIHTYICVAFLIAVQIAVYINVEMNTVYRMIYIIFGIVAIMVSDSISVYLRKGIDLIIRHLLTSFIIFLIMMIVTMDYINTMIVFASVNIVYAVWVMIAQKWLRYELCPSWTMLVYDTGDNYKKAETIALGRPDLIKDVQHCEYNGNIQCIDKYAQMFKIGQMIICLELSTDKVLDYCRREGIIAILEDKKRENGLIYYRPDIESPKHYPLKLYAWSNK